MFRRDSAFAYVGKDCKVHTLTCKASLSMAGLGSRKTAAADLNFLFLRRM